MSESPVPPVPVLPFPSRINPYTADLAGPLLRWAKEEAALPESAVAAWKAARFDVLVGRMYPFADRDLLPEIGQAVLWLFLYDDHLDPGRPGADPGHAGRSARRAAQILTKPSSARPPSDPLLLSLWDVSRKLRERGGDPWWRRCAKDLTDFLDSMRSEVSARAEHRSPDLRSYLLARRRTSGWMLLADLVELCTGHLSERARRTELHTQLRESSADVACAVNDLLSLEKEVATGELHNQVLIRQRLHSCDRPTAQTLTLRWMNARLEDYFRVRDRFQRCRRDGVRPTRAAQSAGTPYTDGLESLMRGSLDWSRETGRYSHRSP